MKTPTPEYWDARIEEALGSQPEKLRELFAHRVTTFTGVELGPPAASAIALLERLTADGYLEKQTREIVDDDGAVVTETIYVRDLAQTRSVDWVIAIHGMNTTGHWQESFTWLLSTTWGRSVPVAVYKYGIVRAGVIMAWRRNTLREQLRVKLAALRDEARARGFTGNPDFIAHSFGTWLFGHLLERELTRPLQERLAFGRVILTGCVLRPDFDWKPLKDAGLVEDVLNHYGTADAVVPWAHATIHNSGPSGTRGFDGSEVLNIRAEGYGHSDLFLRDLAHSYDVYWKPFLKLPREELNTIPDRVDPTTTWRPYPWPLRGTLFPFVALPFIAALIALIHAFIGRGLWEVRGMLAIVGVVSAASVLALFAGIAITQLVRRLFGVR